MALQQHHEDDDRQHYANRGGGGQRPVIDVLAPYSAIATGRIFVSGPVSTAARHILDPLTPSSAADDPDPEPFMRRGGLPVRPAGGEPSLRQWWKAL